MEEDNDLGQEEVSEETSAPEVKDIGREAEVEAAERASLLGTKEDKADTMDAKADPTKPDFWPDDLWDADKNALKYKETYKRLTTAEKRADDLRRILSNKNKAPEEYKFEELPEAISLEDPSFKSFQSAAKEAGLNNEQANRLINEYYNSITEHYSTTKAAEKEKLGPDGEEVIGSLSRFGDARVQTRLFSEEENSIYKGMINSAGAARVMSKIIELTGERPIPVSVAARSEIASIGDIKRELQAAILSKDEHGQEVAREKLQRFD